MFPLGVIIIAALIGYWAALSELEKPMFHHYSVKEQAKVFALGIGSSIIIAVCFLKQAGAI